MRKVLYVWIFAALATVVRAEPMRVAEALEVGQTLAQGETTTESYTITGYITAIEENAMATYGNMTFWIADDRNGGSTNATGGLLIFRGRPDKDLKDGDQVKVTGTLTNYYGKIETSSGSAVEWLESSDDPDPVTPTGLLKVCAQNLENYYFNYNTGRGDYTRDEFASKTRKIVNMMLDVDADIYAFCEVEAKPEVLAQLADSANARVEGTPYVAAFDGIDEDWNETYNNNLKSGFIYRKDRVKTYGNNTGATGGNGYYNHTMRIQAFEQIESHERLVVSMNHFKAKTGGGDQGDAQRITNASNLINALGRVSSDPDILILGDLNCEYGEDPITMIVEAGYEEQLLRYNPNAYSHCYGGGELIDHAMANESMEQQIVNAYVKHICTWKCSSGVTQAMSYSDHDPYVVEIMLGDRETDGLTPSLSPAESGAIKMLIDGKLLIVMPDGSKYSSTGVRISEN